MGIASLFSAVIFGILAAIGHEWYWYILSPIIIAAGGSFFNTSLIQGLTRAYAIFAVPGVQQLRGLIAILLLNTLSALFGAWIIYYGVGGGILFWLCIGTLCIESMIVAVSDSQFKLAVFREEALQNLLQERQGQSD